MNLLSILKYGEDEDGEENNLVPLDRSPLFPPPPTHNSSSVVDGIKSKVNSFVKSRMFDDQTNVSDAQQRTLESQNRVLESQNKSVQHKVDLIKKATEGERAKQDYQLLHKERIVKEKDFRNTEAQLDYQHFHLENQQLKLELERQRLQEQLNGGYIEFESDQVTNLRDERLQEKQAKVQSYMRETEEDSLSARLQALDAWYDEKSEEIMYNKRLDVARRREQLALLDQEYQLRKKQVKAQLRAAKGGGGIKV